MKILDAIRGRTTRDTQPADAAESSDSDAGALGISGYDELSPARIADTLPKRSQVELEAIDDYEREHEDRRVVLDKLRYLRGDEPLPDYDSLDPGEVIAALEGVDMDTLGLVREYELKFHRRSEVLEALAQVRRDRPPDAAGSA